MPPELPKESVEGNAHTASFGNQKIDVYRLIHLSETLPVEEIDLDSLAIFGSGSKYWLEGSQIGPDDILAEYQITRDLDEISKRHPDWKEEIEKIKRADYQTHPILMIGTVVVDGAHRLTKARIDGVQKISVKRFDALPDNVIIGSDK